MTEHHFPSPGAPAGEEGLVDGELLEPRAALASDDDQTDHADTDVIEGEAIDDEFDDDAVHRSVPEAHDDLDADAGTEATDDADSADEATAGESGDLLVLETWQIQIPATGDDAVDAALARLTEVEGLPPSQHPEVYEAVHAGLQEALADLDRS